jgi:hypothetical protein
MTQETDLALSPSTESKQISKSDRNKPVKRDRASRHENADKLQAATRRASEDFAQTTSLVNQIDGFIDHTSSDIAEAIVNAPYKLIEQINEKVSASEPDYSELDDMRREMFAQFRVS